MILTKAQYDTLFSNKAIKRHGLSNSFRHWPNATVPVQFDDVFTVSFKERIKGAMRYIMKHSCIKFDWKNEPTSDHVFVTKAKKCASNVRLKNKF